MTAKPKIKVIKKGEVKPSEKTALTDKKSKQKQAREMVSTVSNWVNEFQRLRSEETKQAFNRFFPRPQNGSV